MSKNTTRVIANAAEPTPAFMLEADDQVVIGGEVRRVAEVNIASEKHTEIVWATLQYDGYGENFDAGEYVSDPEVVRDLKMFNVIRILKVTTRLQ